MATSGNLADAALIERETDGLVESSAVRSAAKVSVEEIRRRCVGSEEGGLSLVAELEARSGLTLVDEELAATLVIEED